MNERLLARIAKEPLNVAFCGGLNAANYITITDTTRATATRDLQELVAFGALEQAGQLKSTRYRRTPPWPADDLSADGSDT